MKLQKCLRVVFSVVMFLLILNINGLAATLYSDNFNDGNAQGWTSYGGTWTVSGGALSVNGGAGFKAVPNGQNFTNFVYEADVKITSTGEAGLIFRVTNPKIGVDAFNGYYFGINATNDQAVLGKMNGSWTLIAIKKVPINSNTYYHLKVIANGPNIQCFVNDNSLNLDPYPKFDVIDSSYPSGNVGVRAHNAASAFDNILVSSYIAPSLGATYTNTVLDNNSDPGVLFYNGTYYLYTTHDGDTDAGIRCYTSTNLVNWTDRGLVLTPATSFGTTGFWAPEVIEKNGTFYMYYTASQRLAVATSTSPLGPFSQSVKAPMHPNIHEIDSHVFRDDNGIYYFYMVRFNNCNEIWGAQLNSDMKTINESTLKRIITPSQTWELDMGNINEGPFMLKHNGTYYLTYSGSHFQSINYGVGYATSSSPLGTFTKYASNPIMKSNAAAHGTGHHCITMSPDGLEMFMVYHRHYSLTQATPRKLCIDRMHFVPQASGPDVLEVYGPTVTAQSAPSALSLKFSDDFNDGNDTGWIKYGGTWAVESGQESLVSANADKAVSSYSTGTDFTLRTDIQLINGGQASVMFNVANPSMGVNTFLGYAAGLNAAAGTVWLAQVDGGGYSMLGSASMTVSSNTTYTLKVVKTGTGNIKVYVNDTLKIQTANTAYLAGGSIGIRGGFGNHVHFDNIKVN